MLMVQKFHSIHEIDPEFIANIEVLLQEDISCFDVLVQKHDIAPENSFFTYFLFFGPTQNAPIGFAQVCLKSIPSKEYRPWFKKLMFWNKEHQHWKQVVWQIGDGASGLCVFDPKYSRSGKEKIQELIREYSSRPEVMAQETFCLKGLQDFQLPWTAEVDWKNESFILEPLPKAFKSYREYLAALDPEMRNLVKESWRKLHNDGSVKLGDYATPDEVPTLPTISEDQKRIWTSWGGKIVTFENDNQVLGCLLILQGKNGNVFFEPFPFEPEGSAIVPDVIYTQYALFKFFEMPEARKCHLMKFGDKLIFDEKDDLKFFKSQGFQVKTLVRHFQSRLPGLTLPV